MSANFSDQELSAIVNAAMVTGMAVAIADMGIVSTAIEAAAMSKEIMGAAAKYPNNTVVQAAFSEAAMRSGKIKMTKPEMKAEDMVAGKVVDQAIAEINSVITALNGKATAEEIQEYKTLLYDVAEAVAEAAGTGLFGSGDPKVSDKEAAALAKIKAALAV
jgi:hypothetical protein